MDIRPVRFSISPTGGDRIHYITPEDVQIVLSRLPVEEYSQLKAVHCNDQAWGNRLLGYTNRGRREIALCALPPRVSLTRYLRRGQSPRQFGAKRGAQWSELAVRRFMLYDVLLHEIGHLQLIVPDSKNPKRKFAGETLAQEFAESWCHKLLSIHFDHPDPVHNYPTKEEISLLG